jgi:uncharacterized membrane protein
VLDLGRLAGNPELVVPLKPEQSRLWELVRDGEMPPEDAEQLTTTEKEAVRTWIASGAAPPRSPPAGAALPAAPPPREQEAPAAPDLPFPQRLLRALGKFHVVVIHFPIALLLAAAAGELWSMRRGLREPAPAVQFCVLLGAAGAVAAAGLGWLRASGGGFAGSSSPAFVLHRLLGTAAGLGAVGLALFSDADARQGVRSWRFRIALFAAAFLAGLAGHFGGTLVYGEDYFNW